MRDHSETIVLRPLRIRDLDELTKFAQDLAREKLRDPELGLVSFDHVPTRAEEEKFLRSTMKGVREGFTVNVAAFAGARVVGNCDITRRRLPDVRHTGVLGIAIAEGYRGQGLGERMVRKALEESRALGVWLVELEVFASNERALKLYRRTGFRLVGRVPSKIQRGQRSFDELRMYADLRDSDKSLTRRRVAD